MGKYQQVESLKNGKIFLLEFYYYFYDVNIKKTQQARKAAISLTVI